MSVEHPYYRNIIERIVFSPEAKRLPLMDFGMLCRLGELAHWATGEPFNPDEYPTLNDLATIAQTSRRTVLRILARLERDGWIQAHRRHRKTTLYTISSDRLDRKTIPFKPSLSVTSGTQDPFKQHPLGVTSGTQDPLLSVTSGTQNPLLSATSGTPSLDPHKIPIGTKKRPPRVRAEPPTTTRKEHETKNRLAQRGKLADVMRAGLSPGRTPTRREARLIAAVLRKLVNKPHRWEDAGDVKDALRTELRRLGITHGPAAFDDAISWLDAAIPRGITSPVQQSA